MEKVLLYNSVFDTEFIYRDFKNTSNCLADVSGAAETTLFPHVLPLLFLLEKTDVTLEESESWESVDTGVAMILSHLDTARTVARNGRIFSANAHDKLQGNGFIA